MTSDVADLKIFVGLVSFEKGSDTTGVLLPDATGAAGWMGGNAQNETQFVELIRLELAEIGLRLIEVEDIRKIDEVADASEFDEHLAFNMECWERGKMTVWGTLYPYIGEGEA